MERYFRRDHREIKCRSFIYYGRMVVYDPCVHRHFILNSARNSRRRFGDGNVGHTALLETKYYRNVCLDVDIPLCRHSASKGKLKMDSQIQSTAKLSNPS